MKHPIFKFTCLTLVALLIAPFLMAAASAPMETMAGGALLCTLPIFMRGPVFEEAEGGAGAGGGVPAPEKKEGEGDDKKETPPPAPGATAKPSLMDRAKALLKPASQIQAELTQAKGQITQITTERDQFKTQVLQLTAERDGYKKQVSDFQALLDTHETEKKTVQTEVIHQLAASGMPESSLPKGGKLDNGNGGNIDDQIRSLQEQATAENDPTKKGTLANAILKLRQKAAKIGES